ncbi:unnamed protein product [Effrenium voratum]|nr:unnamed protein product [Effrenium voratum]
MYSITMQKCIVEEDPHSYAQEMFQYQQKLKLVGADAIYCFVAGHCNNTEVTERTTMSEAEQVCNKRYGSRWTEVGWTDFMAVLARALELGTTHQIPKEWKVTGWGSLVKLARREADISAMTACAMGNFQCDVAYCKMNYCDSPKFRAKFGNLSWSYAMLLLLSLLGASHGLVHNRTADLLHAHLQTTLDAGLAAFHERQLPSDFEETNSTPIVKDVVNIMFGGIFFLLAVSVHWFNEERSAKTEVLLTRGLEDCKSVDANHACAENRGCLIHVQGRAAGKLPIADAQFQDAVVHDCLKLQCTLEVLQWVPATGMVKDTPGQRHVTEWTTSHFDSSRFRQPSPQNPRLPALRSQLPVSLA